MLKVRSKFEGFYKVILDVFNCMAELYIFLLVLGEVNDREDIYVF